VCPPGHTTGAGDARCDALGPFDVYVSHDDLRSPLAQLFAQRPPNPQSPTGRDRNLVFEMAHDRIVLVVRRLTLSSHRRQAARTPAVAGAPATGVAPAVARGRERLGFRDVISSQTGRVGLAAVLDCAAQDALCATIILQDGQRGNPPTGQKECAFRWKLSWPCNCELRVAQAQNS
jgi:hypothetical protein